jgi:hypothetical protein
MNKYIKDTKIFTIILSISFILILVAYILDEIKIQDLEDENQEQQTQLQHQDKIQQMQDSLQFQCQTKDIIILKLKAILQQTNP